GEEPLDFFDAKGCTEAMLDSLGVEATFEPGTAFGLLEGHTATISAGEREIGIVGQIHPDTAANFDIGVPVFLAELRLEEIVAALPERPAYESPSRFPAVRQDIALLIDATTPAGRVLQIARSHRARGIRIEAEIFDEYRGPGVPEGKKSLALALSFRADDRTLTDKDVARIQRGLLQRLKGEVGATLRGA
ncbi:MAG: phenylalanine--tRNA ligase subunit beta, partial [Dehalococcoidia bacterium]